MQLLQLAAPLYGGTLAAVGQPLPPPAVEIIIPPSDNLQRARPRITLSTFVAYPGARVEALMRSAAFGATEHRYDI
jgi:hypothetical protein